MEVEAALPHVIEVAARAGVRLKAVRGEPLPVPVLGMSLRDDELTLGPALVETLSSDALAYAVVFFLKGSRSATKGDGAIFGVAFLLSLTAAWGVFRGLGPTLAAALVAVPLTLAAFVVYGMLIMVPFNVYRTKAATRKGLRIAGLAGAEEYVTKNYRYSLGGLEPVERGYGTGVPTSGISELRKTAARMGLA